MFVSWVRTLADHWFSPSLVRFRREPAVECGACPSPPAQCKYRPTPWPPWQWSTTCGSHRAPVCPHNNHVSQIYIFPNKNQKIMDRGCTSSTAPIIMYLVLRLGAFFRWTFFYNKFFAFIYFFYSVFFALNYFICISIFHIFIVITH